MSKGCARSSKKGCGGLAAGRAVRIDEHSVVRFVFERLFEATKSVLGIGVSDEKPAILPVGEAIASIAGEYWCLSAQVASLVDNCGTLARMSGMSQTEGTKGPTSDPLWLVRYGRTRSTAKYAAILEVPWHNQESRGITELCARVRCPRHGEHLHPWIVERLTPLEGEADGRRNGKTGIVREGETPVIEPRVWHDWWNATDRDILELQVEITPGERFVHMIEIIWPRTARTHRQQGHAGCAPLIAQENRDVMVFRAPRPLFQRMIFGTLAPIARGGGYRATYPAALAHYARVACIACSTP